MPIITRLSPHLIQPQYPARVDSSNPLALGLKAAFTAVGGGGLYEHLNKSFPTSDNGVRRVTEKGVLRDYADGTKAVFANRPDYHLTGAMTIIVIADVDTLTNYGALVSCADTPTTNGWELRVGVSGTGSQILWHRANTAERQFKASTANLITAGSKNNFIAVICSSGLVETAPTYNINGISYAGAASSGAGTGAQTAAIDPLYIATREDAVTKLDGAIGLVLLFDRALSFDETERIRLNPWQIFQPLSRNIYVESAGGGTTLTLTDATHTQTADTIALTQAHFLVLQEALSAHLADAVVLTQAHNITLAEMLHAQSADNIALSQAHVIAVSDVTHAHSADGVILTQAHNLTLQDATHPHLADVVVLGAAGTLVVSDGLHAHLADGVVLTQQHVLLVQAADHVQAADTITLTQAHNLTLAEALHLQLADNVVFSGGVTLVLSDATHPHSADGITISVAYSLAIQEAIHATLADNLALGQVHQLIVSDALHAMLAGNIAFSVIPTPDSRVLLIQAENRVLVVAREERTITIH